MVDKSDYSWWTQALIALKQGVKHALPIHADTPQAGYYKIRDGHKTAPWMALAIWQDEIGWIVEPHQYSNGRAFTAEEIWQWAAKHPIEYDLYVKVAEQGQPWPDEVTFTGKLSGVAMTIKSNQYGLSDAERLQAELEDLREQAEAWLKDQDGVISTKSQADKAINYADRFAAIEAEAEKIRKAEKEEFLEAGRKVDALYNPIKVGAADMKRNLKALVLPYAEAEDLKRRAHAAVKHVEVEAVKLGSGARRSSLREQVVYTITDMKALLDWASKLDPMPFVLVEALQKVADEYGTRAPGVEKHTVKKVV